MSTAKDAHQGMDRMYRRTRHIYDFTRKYYLLGRDALIGDLNVQPGETVCEAGCGTARNLILMAKRYPAAHFFGFDASSVMLKTAAAALERAGLQEKVPLRVALAQDFSFEAFGLTEKFDRIVFSYALSIMDDWQPAVERALTQIKAGGTIHVVDFGNQQGLPRWFKAMLGAWLKQFHVRFKPEIKAYFEALQASGRGTMTYRDVSRGYAYILTFKAN